VLADEAKHWRETVLQFRHRVKDTEFTYAAVKRALDIGSDDGMRELLAIMQHLGIIRCISKDKSLAQRRYEYPILFRHDRRK